MISQINENEVNVMNGNELRDLYFEIKSYLQVLEEEQEQVKGTRFEDKFQMKDQIEDLQKMISDIQIGIFNFRGKRKLN